MDSILTSIKKLLGIAEDYTHFDEDIIMHINSVFSVLSQLGVGPSEGFIITGKNETWNEFMDSSTLEAVKSYMHYKVKLLFDPPLSSNTMEAMNRVISELEFRLNFEAESKADDSNV